jgi:hypothetical protein
VRPCSLAGSTNTVVETVVSMFSVVIIITMKITGMDQEEEFWDLRTLQTILDL